MDGSIYPFDQESSTIEKPEELYTIEIRMQRYRKEIKKIQALLPLLTRVNIDFLPIDSKIILGLPIPKDISPLFSSSAIKHPFGGGPYLHLLQAALYLEKEKPTEFTRFFPSSSKGCLFHEAFTELEEERKVVQVALKALINTLHGEEARPEIKKLLQNLTTLSSETLLPMDEIIAIFEEAKQKKEDEEEHEISVDSPKKPRRFSVPQLPRTVSSLFHIPTHMPKVKTPSSPQTDLQSTPYPSPRNFSQRAQNQSSPQESSFDQDQLNTKKDFEKILLKIDSDFFFCTTDNRKREETKTLLLRLFAENEPFFREHPDLLRIFLGRYLRFHYIPCSIDSKRFSLITAMLRTCLEKGSIPDTLHLFSLPEQKEKIPFFSRQCTDQIGKAMSSLERPLEFLEGKLKSLKEAQENMRKTIEALITKEPETLQSLKTRYPDAFAKKTALYFALKACSQHRDFEAFSKTKSSSELLKKMGQNKILLKKFSDMSKSLKTATPIFVVNELSDSINQLMSYYHELPAAIKALTKAIGQNPKGDHWLQKSMDQGGTREARIYALLQSPYFFIDDIAPIGFENAFDGDQK